MSLPGLHRASLFLSSTPQYFKRALRYRILLRCSNRLSRCMPSSGIRSQTWYGHGCAPYVVLSMCTADLSIRLQLCLTAEMSVFPFWNLLICYEGEERREKDTYITNEDASRLPKGGRRTAVVKNEDSASNEPKTAFFDIRGAGNWIDGIKLVAWATSLYLHLQHFTFPPDYHLHQNAVVLGRSLPGRAKSTALKCAKSTCSLNTFVFAIWCDHESSAVAYSVFISCVLTIGHIVGSSAKVWSCQTCKNNQWRSWGGDGEAGPLQSLQWGPPADSSHERHEWAAEGITICAATFFCLFWLPGCWAFVKWIAKRVQGKVAEKFTGSERHWERDAKERDPKSFVQAKATSLGQGHLVTRLRRDIEKSDAIAPRPHSRPSPCPPKSQTIFRLHWMHWCQRRLPYSLSAIEALANILICGL